MLGLLPQARLGHPLLTQRLARGLELVAQIADHLLEVRLAAPSLAQSLFVSSQLVLGSGTGFESVWRSFSAAATRPWTSTFRLPSDSLSSVQRDNCSSWETISDSMRCRPCWWESSRSWSSVELPAPAGAGGAGLLALGP